jgi:predicted Rossmann fold nucleotide-binding protein DprA/Smf involved in DNA uptake
MYKQKENSKKQRRKLTNLKSDRGKLYKDLKRKVKHRKTATEKNEMRKFHVCEEGGVGKRSINKERRADTMKREKVSLEKMGCMKKVPKGK